MVIIVVKSQVATLLNISECLYTKYLQYQFRFRQLPAPDRTKGEVYQGGKEAQEHAILTVV